MRDESSSPVLYVKLIYSDKTKKILSIFRTKGNKSINPFDYLNQYFNTKMAIIFESIYLAKNIISLQIKAHEVYIKPSDHLNQENQFWKLKKVMMKTIMKVIMKINHLKKMKTMYLKIKSHYIFNTNYYCIKN